MAWFGLDPESVATRVKASGLPARIPSLGGSVARGIVGFTLVSLVGFAPWALAGKWFYRSVGEAGMYAACALVFIGLSGVALHGLIIGPGSLSRFYKLFGIAFLAYSAAWIVGYMALRRHTGSAVGLLAGTAAMGAMLAFAFGNPGAALKAIPALFVTNAIGYFAGGWVEARVAVREGTLAMMLWGLCYGVGLGAGLGLAFYSCQERVRRLLASGS